MTKDKPPKPRTVITESDSAATIAALHDAWRLAMCRATSSARQPVAQGNRSLRATGSSQTLLAVTAILGEGKRER